MLRFVRKSAIFSLMNSIPKTAEQVRRRIESIPVGEPFAPSTFLECGTRASVDQALSRLVKAGTISRVARGLYVRPEISRYVGKVMPEPIKVAESIAKSAGAVVQVHGAEAARQLELTTQIPMRSLFLTSGPSRRLRVGGNTIELRHVSPRKLALAGRPAGLALAAMWYLGKAEVTPNVVQKIRKKLGINEFEALRSAAGTMPAWMSDVIYRQQQMNHGAHA